jgi:predicted alpha/beta hydrolase family esterase
MAAMKQTTLIVPGYRGSEPEHWQSWLESRLPTARRVAGIDWESPRLPDWADAVGRAIDAASRPVWLVAHSFGCLAGVLAASTRPERVAGMLLVAPADPERFTVQGFRTADTLAEGIGERLAAIRLVCPALLVASTNDPWMNFSTAAYWSRRWGCGLRSLGAAGHINAESGFGPWPEGERLLQAMQATPGAHLLGGIDLAERNVRFA